MNDYLMLGFMLVAALTAASTGLRNERAMAGARRLTALERRLGVDARNPAAQAAKLETQSTAAISILTIGLFYVGYWVS